MNYSKAFLFSVMILAGMTSRAQLYGHWVNRMPLQCVNGDTAQYWKWDCDTAVAIDSSYYVNYPLWDTAQTRIRTLIHKKQAHHKKKEPQNFLTIVSSSVHAGYYNGVGTTSLHSMGPLIDSTNYITGYHWHNNSADHDRRIKKTAIR